MRTGEVVTIICAFILGWVIGARGRVCPELPPGGRLVTCDVLVGEYWEEIPCRVRYDRKPAGPLD